MLPTLPPDTRSLLQAIVDFYSERSQLTLALYDRSSNVPILPTAFPSPFRGFCRYCYEIQRTSRGQTLCLEDQQRRGSRSEGAAFEICHAGIHTFRIPIEVNGVRPASLIVGKFRLSDAEEAEQAKAHRENVAKKLEIDATSYEVLLEAFNSIPEMTREEVHRKAQEVEPALELCRHVYRLVIDKQELGRRVVEFEDHEVSVAHELSLALQNPMTFADNIWSQAHEEALDITQLRDRSQELINEIEILKIQVDNLSGQVILGEYDFATHDIVALIQQCAATYRGKAARQDIQILHKFDSPSQFLPMSRMHMKHALHNLMHNALKYSHKGKETRPRTIEIEGRRSGPFYVVAIENFGFGIMPGEIDKIFERRYRGEAVRQLKGKSGSGLGLYLVKEVIERHNGEIHATSVPFGMGHKVRFTVTLPLQ